MTITRRNPAVRALALLLAFVLLGGLLAVSAQAANASNVKQYNHYVCIGDSIAAGYGSYARDVRGFVTVPEAYHSHVAAATGATVQSLAHTGMRTVEVRWLLDDDYSASAEAESLRAMYFNGLHDILWWMQISHDTPDSPDLARYADPDSEYYIRPAIRETLRPYINAGEKGGAYGFKEFYRQQIAASDLVTVALGLNDIFLYAMKTTAAKLPNLNLVTEVLDFMNNMRIGSDAFKANWAPMINRIHELSPNAKIVVVGMYNPFGKVKAFSTQETVAVGRLADVLVASLNSYMKSQAASLNYEYADVTNTPIDDTVPFSDPTFFDEIVKDCHPTPEGHKYIADQIIAVLPERGQDDPAPSGLPFRDVKTTDWFYDEVKYCYENGLMNGTTPTTFEPYATTTRAQLAMVLYRIEKEPSVSGMTCPFTDVPADAWYRNAVVWAYNRGVVNGTSPTTFAPDENITREQMVTMLFRYSGEQAPSGTLDMFSDAAQVSEYARGPVLWAVRSGIVGGMGDGTFQPQGSATRGQLARILHMYQIR